MRSPCGCDHTGAVKVWCDMHFIVKLRDRVAELERELSEARLRVCTTVIGCGECERCRAVASETRLREALEKYGDHHPCCDYGDVIVSIPCSCGFSAALASVDDGLPDAAHMNGAATAPKKP